VTARASGRRYGGGEQDAYVAKLAPDGSALVYATYLGGSAADGPAGTHALALDAHGHAFATGFTYSPDFPATAGAFAASYAGGRRGKWEEIGDLFVAKLSPDGGLLASTFVGGGRAESPEGIALDAGGRVFVTGMTLSADFPVTPGALQKPLRGGSDAFLVVLAPDFRRLLYATVLGGGSPSPTAEAFRAVAVAPDGAVLAGGTTDSRDWPTQRPLQAAPGGGIDAAVVRLVPAPAP
jgi:hypothetical protein